MITFTDDVFLDYFNAKIWPGNTKIVKKLEKHWVQGSKIWENNQENQIINIFKKHFENSLKFPDFFVPQKWENS